MQQYYIMLIVCTCAALIVLVAHRRALKPYLSRSCQGLNWRRTFPEASADEIRSFLNLFGAAFGFRERQLLKFAPTDGLLQIHAACNPLQGVDALEFESLSSSLQRQYKFNLQSAWHAGLTLGQLFSLVRRSAP